MDKKVSDQEQVGKGKARDDSGPTSNPKTDQANQPATDRDRGHLLLRVTKSASVLSGAIFSGTPSNEILSSVGVDDKGQTSRAQPAASDAGEPSSSQIRANQPAGLPSLRSAAAEDHVAREEAAFASFLDGTESFVPSEPTVLEKAWDCAQSVHESRSQKRQANDFASSIEAQEAVDGRGVIEILGTNDEELPDFIEDETLSHQDLFNLRLALFGDGNRDGNGSNSGQLPPGWDNLLNFMPQYLHLGECGRYQADVLSNSLRAEESSMHLGTGDLDEGWQQWIDQWSDVLTRYRDEVWGDLGSLVREARAEVAKLADVEPSEPPPQPKALLRLRNILGHLRG